MTLRGTTALAATVFLLVTACGSEPTSDTPENALAALVKAGNDRDDAAVRKLVCPEKWQENLTFAATKAQVVELDPRLGDMSYHFTDSGIKDKTDTTATGRMDLDVSGKPDDLSAEAENGLDAMQAPLPIALYGPDRSIKLVKRDSGWVACD